MFPSVTSKDESILDKIKQKHWDQRFVKNSIPQYSPLKDRHTKSYRKIISQTSKAQKNQIENTSVITKKKTYFQKKLDLMDNLKSLHPVYFTHLQQFQDFLTQSKLPAFYVYYSLLPLLKEIDINGFIIKHKKLIKQKNSSYHRISTAISARQECLKRMQKSISGLKSKKEEEIQKMKNELKQQINHYRMLTSNSIDQIKKWRDNLNLTDEKAVFYTGLQENYLIKILNDNQFIFHSHLANYINFGQKNDPFLIVPLKKAQGKQSSEFLEILQTQKNLAYYQKYMEYLATEKAYQLSINYVSPVHKKVYDNPVIQKIYKSKSTLKLDQNYNSNTRQKIEEQNFSEMEKNKIRQQRLKKNQERINSIKSIYETYSNKIKIKQAKKEAVKMQKAQTDVQQKRESLKKHKQKQQKKSQRKKSIISDTQFQNMVKFKIEREKGSNSKKVNSQTKSIPKTMKIEKNQDKMIQNLRQIQTTLKNKLQFIHQDVKTEQSVLPTTLERTNQKYLKKNNDDLIKELKSQIMSNLQKQTQERELQRKKRRQDQQKALQEIKQKMKKEMEQKLQQKKRQKLMEKQQLQKKLKQQQDRLNKQRQIQLQLQLKLAKQKQLRQLQKIKRESLQRQNKFREQLQKQQKLRREKEQIIQRERQQKQKILDELKKKQLRQEVQQEIRSQMKLKYGQNPKLYDREEMQLLKSQKQQQLSKQIQLLKMKQNQQIEQIRRQNQLRQRMLKLKKDEEQLKRKEVEQLMKNVIQSEKQQLHRETIKKRIQLEEDIKTNAKQKLLQQYKTERQMILEQTKYQRQKQFQQDIYRDKIRQKIQKQMRMEAIQRTKKEMDQRQNRKYQMSKKMETVKNNFNIEVQLDKGRIQDQVKKQLIEKVIFDKQAERQAAKTDLRTQFQRQLMASSIPQIYHTKQSDPIMRKNIQSYKGDDYLNRKLDQIDRERPTNQKSSRVIFQQQQISPQKLRQSINKSSLNNQQLYIYTKKKSRVSQKRQESALKIPTKLQQQQEGFQLMKVQKSSMKSELQGDIRMTKKTSKMQKIEQETYEKKKKKSNHKQQQSESQVQIKIKKKNNKKTKIKKRKYEAEEQSEQDNESSDYQQKNKKQSNKKKREQTESHSSQEQLGQLPQLTYSPKKMSSIKYPQQITSNQKHKLNRQMSKNTDLQHSTNNLARNSSLKLTKIHYDVQKPKQNVLQQSQVSQIQLRQSKVAVQSKYLIKLQAIHEQELDQYLEQHFTQLPQIQRIIQLIDRQELYRKLIGELTFCLLIGWQGNICVGMAFAYHDRTKTDLRKFTLVHISSYHDEQLKDFIISTVNYIFKKDPCDQIEFHYKFNETNQNELAFSTDFNKWFDKYGNVYQKRVDDNIFQRKYVMKRQFNQKCDVMLGGINKNTFRNLFTVYCGVIMSDSDMIQFKEELRDVITPENQISYAIMIAQLFRTYLTPDQAEVLKTKVKQFAKLKELLVLVVMLQKKKVKMEQIKLSQSKNLIELNMKLMSQGKELIRYCKDGGMDHNRIYFAELTQNFNLPFNFQTTSLPVEANQSEIRQISYFRLSPLAPHKLHIIKSSLYNSQLHILPTQNIKYKLFVINAQQYNQIKQKNHLDVFMYVRLFLKNVKSHNVASWKYVWLPQMTDKAAFSIRQFKSFLNKDIYCHDNLNISYKQFLPNAMIIEPQHRDLVITPPFIVGVMSMSLQQVTQGSPLYARMINVDALRTLQIEQQN